MPQVYIKDNLYHKIVSLGLLARIDVVQFIEEAVEDKLRIRIQKTKQERGD